MERIVPENETFEEFKQKKCPKCKHYNTREYQECNLVKKINGKIDCIKYEE